MVYISGNDYSQFYFNNTIFNSIYGNYLFYIYSNFEQTIEMDNIYINGNNNFIETLDVSIIYCSYNDNGKLTIKNSKFEKIKMGSSTSSIAFLFIIVVHMHVKQ